MSSEGPHIVFVSGLSGSGKTTAIAALEDLSFCCVDNFPAQLTDPFLELCAKAEPPIDRIALVVDAREPQFLQRFPDVLGELRRRGGRVEVLFLDCSDETLARRYRETRRVHPLSPEGSVERGIERERTLLQDVLRLADQRIDTSSLNVHQLKSAVAQRVLGGARQTVVNLVSFGFRYGTPSAAELLFDLRFLPNPYFEEQLRDGSGRDAEVAAYVLDNERGAELYRRLTDFLHFLLPLYDAEGRAYVTVGIGCTGGRHRSVALVCALEAWLNEAGREVHVEHRDVERPL